MSEVLEQVFLSKLFGVLLLIAIPPLFILIYHHPRMCAIALTKHRIFMLSVISYGFHI
jgi:hypothetical protein